MKIQQLGHTVIYPKISEGDIRNTLKESGIIKEKGNSYLIGYMGGLYIVTLLFPSLTNCKGEPISPESNSERTIWSSKELNSVFPPLIEGLLNSDKVIKFYDKVIEDYDSIEDLFDR